MSRFINTELKSDSESSDSVLDSRKIGANVDNELMAKLKFWFWIRHFGHTFCLCLYF